MIAPLAMTAKDHIDVGGGPPEILEENPGKCMADLLDGQGIRDYLTQNKKSLDEILDLEAPTSVKISCLNWYISDLEFLKSLNRLPKEYEGNILRYKNILQKLDS